MVGFVPLCDGPNLLKPLVTPRNICWLLNAVSPCAVKEFKNAALESMCLNLEGMLENRYDLDDIEGHR